MAVRHASNWRFGGRPSVVQTSGETYSAGGVVLKVLRQFDGKAWHSSE
jgi:hypothetical protein